MSLTVVPDAPEKGGRPTQPTGRWALAIGIAVSVIAHATLIGIGVLRLEFGHAAEPPKPIPVQLVPDPNPPKVKPPPAPAPPSPRSRLKPNRPRSRRNRLHRSRQCRHRRRSPQRASCKTDASQTALDTLRSDIERCWTIPSGWSDPKQVTVVVDFAMTREGKVTARPTVIEFAANQYGAAAAKNAIDAVLKCGPYSLPPEKYQDWQHVQVRLAPPG